MGIVYLNGTYLPAEQAYVPVLDRGFIFGDGIYEVIPVYGGHLFRFEAHMIRLDNSLTAVRMQNPRTAPQWREILEGLIRQNGGGDLSIYLQVTRGVAKRDHAIPPNIQATVFVMANPLQTPDNALLEAGVSAISLEDIRWKNCHIKAISLLPNILLRQAAADAGAVEAILIRDGLVTEGAASNVFAVLDNTLVTPAKGPTLLPGITRDLILELAQANGIRCAETDIPAAALMSAEEIWLTSSTKEIVPVTKLNGNVVGCGRPGPLWRSMYTLYQAYKQRLRAKSPSMPH